MKETEKDQPETKPVVEENPKEDPYWKNYQEFLVNLP